MKNQYFLVYISLYLILSSCHRLVEDDLKNTQLVPTMNSLLQSDSTFRVQISLSSGLSDTTPVLVSNAVVVIESNLDTPDTLLHDEKGWYVSSRLIKAGGKYSCKATIPGYPTLSAQTTVPLPTEISSVKYQKSAGRDEEGGKISSLEFTIQNDKSTSKFWQVSLISEGVLAVYDFENKKWIEYFGTEYKDIYMIAGQDPVLLNEANPLTLFSNKFIAGNSYKVKFYYNATYTNFNSTHKHYIILKSVDESFYQYLKQYYIYSTSGFIDIGHTAQRYPLYINVKNGLGIFTGLSVFKKEFTFQNED